MLAGFSSFFWLKFLEVAPKKKKKKSTVLQKP